MKRFRKTNVTSVPEIPLLIDEDDYMSAIPGLECEEKTSKAKPISTLIEQFDLPSEDLGKKNKRRKVDELMSAVLETGLRTSLVPKPPDSESKSVGDLDQKKENVGWKLLQKFGYKADEKVEKLGNSDSSVLQLKGLGRNESGITEPLDILPFTEQLKEGKTGLGMKQHEHRIVEQRREKTREIETRFFNLQQFFSFYATRYKEHEKIVKVIYELDLRKSNDDDDNNGDEEGNDINFSIEETKALHQRYQHRLLPTTSDNDEQIHEDTGLSFPNPRDIHSKTEEDMR